MSISAAIQSNHREVEAVIRTKNLAVAFCRGSHGQPGRAHGKCIEKFTSCNHEFSLLADFLRNAQQEIPAFINAFLSPSMLARVEASGVPAPRQWVSRLSPCRKPSRCKACSCPTQCTIPAPTVARSY